MNSRPPRRRMRRCLVAACAVIWVGAFVATHIPAQDVPDIQVKDTALHAVGYFVITGSFVLALFSYRLSRRRALVVLAVMLAYGAFDEITQPLVNRSAELGDWTADAIGATGAVVIVGLAFAFFARLRARAKADAP